jgi:hypothetical protein
MGVTVPASLLSGLQHLTRLQLGHIKVAPDVVAGRTQLQHLQLEGCSVPGAAAGQAQLLSHLQSLQELTHLDLHGSLQPAFGQLATPPAAAYSALTASSKLQHLNVRFCTLPAGTWQHILPAGRQLSHLQTLDISDVRLPGGSSHPASAPEGSLLCSRCPMLQSLHMGWLRLRAEQLAPLQGLRGLHILHLAPSCHDDLKSMHEVSELTGLRELSIHDSYSPEGRLEELLLLLTQLKQLTMLKYGRHSGYVHHAALTSEVRRIAMIDAASLSFMFHL